MRWSQAIPAIRSAQSRPNVLVALTGVVLTVALGLSAVHRLRASANHISCTDNQGIMGKAILQFTQQNDGLLPSNTPDDSPGEDRGSHVMRVLPYLGHGDLFKKYRSDLDWADPVNAQVVKTRLSFLHCPEAPNADRVIKGIRPEDRGGAKYSAAPSDYTAVPGITNALVPAVFPADYDRSGAMPTATPRKITDISDGISTTLIIVEISDKPHHWRAGKIIDKPETNDVGAGAWASPGNTNNPRGYSWDGAGFPGPCPMNCSSLFAIYAFHPGGSNILLADGSVRFVKQTMDVNILYALITSRGGEILNLDDF
jgi:prepilin-type processing-associated H-X9-DG protein